METNLDIENSMKHINSSIRREFDVLEKQSMEMNMAILNLPVVKNVIARYEATIDEKNKLIETLIQEKLNALLEEKMEPLRKVISQLRDCILSSEEHIQLQIDELSYVSEEEQEEEEVKEDEEEEDQDIGEDEEELEDDVEEVKEEELEDDVEEVKEDEEVFEIEIDDVTYFTNNEENGILYKVDETGEPGKQIGIIKEGEAIFS
jgi:ABC-type multidrug transport system fused ATPase/permease subunit